MPAGRTRSDVPVTTIRAPGHKPREETALCTHQADVLVYNFDVDSIAVSVFLDYPVNRIGMIRDKLEKGVSAHAV
jgi:hypothetical protein